jgi:hypothetical protein
MSGTVAGGGVNGRRPGGRRLDHAAERVVGVDVHGEEIGRDARPAIDELRGSKLYGCR